MPFQDSTLHGTGLSGLKHLRKHDRLKAPVSFPHHT